MSVGGACAVALEGLGESLRAREATIREAHALSAQARISAFVVGGAAPVAYLVFVSLADPGPLDLLVTTNPGRACLMVGLLLEGLAALWMRALLRSDVRTPSLLAWRGGVPVALPVRRRGRPAARRRRVAAGCAGFAPPKARRSRSTRSVFVPGAVRSVVGRFVSVRRDRRTAYVIGRELPLVLDLLQVAVSAGARRTGRSSSRCGGARPCPARRSAPRSTRPAVGSSLRDALDALAVEAPPPHTGHRRAARERPGSALPPGLRSPGWPTTSGPISGGAREARARTLPVKLLFPLVFLVLPAFGLLTVVPALLTALSRT